ncbi:MAG: glycosyltransferase family 39 protein, partial [Candidatus Binatia bacterium]
MESLFLVAVFIYNANGTHSFAVDSNSTRLLPYSILEEMDFDLEEFTFLYSERIPPYLVRAEKHLVSAYPPGPAIMALPFYIPAFVSGVSAQSNLMIQVEKIAASVFVALSAALIYQCIASIEGGKTALLFALIYAFGTSSLSISSQGLWQHGPSQLLLVASLYGLVRGRERERWVGLAGLPLGGSVLCRPTDILVAVPLAVYVLHRHRQQWIAFALGALPSVLFVAGYNLWYFGSVMRMGYDQGFFSGNGWATPFAEGLPGILFSPSRGILIYSPVFIFALWGAYLAWRSRNYVLFRYLTVSVILVVLLY